MISAVKIYLEVIKAKFASRMSYRGDFVISMTMVLFAEMLIPFITLLIYTTGASYPGWGLYEALLLQGIFMLSRGIAFPFFFGMVGNTLVKVRDGTYDLILLKPRSAIFISMVTGFDAENIGTFAGGLIITAVSLSHVPAPGVLNWIQFILLFTLSLTVLLSFALIMSATVFKWVGNSRVYEIFDCIESFGLYPRTIFSKSIQTIISSVIPVAMIGFFPSSVLLGKPLENIMAAPAVCIVFLLSSIYFWNFMLKKYTSAGG